MDLKPAFIYSPYYYASFGEHVFPVQKYKLLYERIKKESLLSQADLLEPSPATVEDLFLVHLPDYVRDFMNFEYTPPIMTSELPITKEIRDFYLLMTGGTILAAKEALKRGRAMNLNGGFHHAFPDHAEGFCYLNDIAIAIRCLKKEEKIKRALVIDCDLHQGNGTAYIFQRDPEVFTFSIHQENLYPIKEKSDQDIGLPDYTGDDLYLEHLRRTIPPVFESHRPEIVCYVAGADPYKGDQLGNLQLTKEGLLSRDEVVIGESVKRNIPIFAVLAGGYATDVYDVVDIHFNTAKTLVKGLPSKARSDHF